MSDVIDAQVDALGSDKHAAVTVTIGKKAARLLLAARAIALSASAPDAARDAAVAALEAAGETRSGFHHPQHAQLGLVGAAERPMIVRLRALLE